MNDRLVRERVTSHQDDHLCYVPNGPASSYDVYYAHRRGLLLGTVRRRTRTSWEAADADGHRFGVGDARWVAATNLWPKGKP